MKYTIKLALLALFATMTFSSCSDFFAADTDVVLESKEYIDEENEMYAGFLGIVTKLQKIGDKSIYINDTRAELLEPTPNASSELFEIYNYANDPENNSYADPAGYYEVIIACNDYLAKVYTFKQENTNTIFKNKDKINAYSQLVSGALRIKAWTYLTLAKIYGEAIWFDDPLTEKKDISQFPVKNLDDVVLSCKNLLSEGFDGVPGNLSFIPNGVEDKIGFWVHYIEPTRTDDGGLYSFWNFMAPEYFALWSELCLWSGDYQDAVNTLLEAMNRRMGASLTQGSNLIPWLQNQMMQTRFDEIFRRTNPLRQATVSVITYNYMYNQTNNIFRHFGMNYPNEYLLRPSEIGAYRFDGDTAAVFNYWAPGSSGRSSDPRNPASTAGGLRYISKYYNSSYRVPSQDDVHIYIYCATDLYFMLAEALNNLGRYTETDALINNGYGPFGTDRGWPGFLPAAWTNTNGGDRGIRGKYVNATNLGRPFKKIEDGVNEENKKFNDLSLLDEMMLEFAVQGRTLPAMIRMARRYNDNNIIADRVCPKYGENAETIRQKILNGEYFIKWNLK